MDRSIRYQIGFKITIQPIAVGVRFEDDILEPVRDIMLSTISHEDQVLAAMVEDLPSNPEDALEALVAEIRKTMPSIFDVAQDLAAERYDMAVGVVIENKRRTKERRDAAMDAHLEERRARKAAADG